MTHRDTLLTRDLLHRLAPGGGADEEPVFALGRLHAREERRGEESLFDYAGRSSWTARSTAAGSADHDRARTRCTLPWRPAG